VPVLVNPVLRENTEAKTDLGLKMKIGPDRVSVVQASSDRQQKLKAYCECLQRQHLRGNKTDP
jgi:hypothetical protein